MSSLPLVAPSAMFLGATHLVCTIFRVKTRIRWKKQQVVSLRYQRWSVCTGCLQFHVSNLKFPDVWVFGSKIFYQTEIITSDFCTYQRWGAEPNDLYFSLHFWVNEYILVLKASPKHNRLILRCRWWSNKKVSIFNHDLLVGGFNPFEKDSSKWESSPIFGVKIQHIWNHHLV